MDVTTDREVDVLVVGSGAAGLTAAAVAASQGLEVLLLEKARLFGGTTAVSGGGLWIPMNRHMSEVGLDDSREEALEYARACASHSEDDDLVVALVDHGALMVDYLEDHLGVELQPWPAGGGTLDYRPWLRGARHGGRPLCSQRVEREPLGEWGDRIRMGRAGSWHMNPTDYYRNRVHLMSAEDSPPTYASDPNAPVEAFANGTALAAQLVRSCLSSGVEFQGATRVERLLVEDGRVVGAVAVTSGESVRVLTRGGVVLATGGYGANEELVNRWLHRPIMYTCEVETNEGDGHLMGMEIGAAVSGLGDAWWMPHMALGEGPTGLLNTAGTREDRILPHTMLVNSRGRRFVNEAMNYYDVAEALGLKIGATERNWPAWFIFDQQGVDRYAMLAWRVTPAASGHWLFSSDSVAGLAKQIGVPATELEETVDRFNRFAESGEDRDFGRGSTEWDLAWGDPAHGPNPCLGTVAKPQFYAMRLLPGALATRGGLRITPNAEVLSVRGQKIAGLYAAGNCSNGAVPGAYVGPGATIGAAMTFGFLAALHLAQNRQPTATSVHRGRC